jgi:putative transposase
MFVTNPAVGQIAKSFNDASSKEKTKGTGTRLACLTMVYKPMESASKHWRQLNSSGLLRDIIAGAAYIDGVKQNAA